MWSARFIPVLILTSTSAIVSARRTSTQWDIHILDLVKVSYRSLESIPDRKPDSVVPWLPARQYDGSVGVLQYDFIVPVITKQDESHVKRSSEVSVFAASPCQNKSVCATKDHCSHTYASHLCLPHPHVSVEKRQTYRNAVTEWNSQLWVLVCLVSASQSTQWGSLLSDVKTLNAPKLVHLWERSWKNRESSFRVQSCQSRRWDKNLHSHTDLTASTLHISLYRRVSDKIRWRDRSPKSLS